MGQIDSFKRVLGVAGQTTSGKAGIEVKEEIEMPEKKPKDSPAPIVRTEKKMSSLCVSEQTREEVRLLSHWAFKRGIIKGKTTEDLLRKILDDFKKKHPEVNNLINGMR